MIHWCESSKLRRTSKDTRDEKKNTRHWQVADWKKFRWITGTVIERKIRRFGVSYDREKKRTWEIKNHKSAPVKARRARSGRTSGRRRCNKWQTRASTLLVRVAATLPDGATARPKPNTKFNGTRLLPPFPSSFRNSFRRDWKVFQHMYTHLYEYIISVDKTLRNFIDMVTHETRLWSRSWKEIWEYKDRLFWK